MIISSRCSDERVKRQLVRVFDATGRLVTSGTVGGSGSLSMASLSSGAYVVHAQPVGAGTPWAARFVKATLR
ncbi:MAG: T9SS type A sorting domain-containing protein [Flavobacteriales bacterium]|nr:T9SS type A sorting domain-containing protein [Flavobacteriales bacterium]MCB0785801.1 T9SS type A sorting domain-containing protein [Flavobacteriales bacterium]MCB0788644.1 T9SS type A sorting domain-containing protein [Flavobacteriales bacterium]MCB0810556.1 T9SS type A sorting domain-containing protein [Flavobacteriales bacterium]